MSSFLQTPVGGMDLSSREMQDQIGQALDKFISDLQALSMEAGMRLIKKVGTSIFSGPQKLRLLSAINQTIAVGIAPPDEKYQKHFALQQHHIFRVER